jgi:uncharacterized protein
MSSGKRPFSGNGPGGSGDESGPSGGSRKRSPPMGRASAPKAPPGGRTGTCPRCGKPAQWEGNPHRPFCSERCRMIDLGHWADGSYAIPDEKVPDKDDEE